MPMEKKIVPYGYHVGYGYVGYVNGVKVLFPTEREYYELLELQELEKSMKKENDQI